MDKVHKNQKYPFYLDGSGSYESDDRSTWFSGVSDS